QLFCEGDRAVDGLPSLSRQADNEIAMYQETKPMAVPGELSGAINRGALFDVLENLGIARFVTDDQEPATCLFHAFQSFIIGSDPRRAGPGELQRLQFCA